MCHLCYKDNFDDDSWFTYRCTESEDKVDYDSIYENCPLRPLPEKKIQTTSAVIKHENDSPEEVYNYGKIDGYNECLDEILGDK